MRDGDTPLACFPRAPRSFLRPLLSSPCYAGYQTCPCTTFKIPLHLWTKRLTTLKLYKTSKLSSITIGSGCLSFTWANRSVPVWANNSTQNSGLVKFVLESQLLFAQISSIYQKTATKPWNWNQRWLWRNVTGISVWNIPTGKTGLPFQTFRCSRKFSTETTRKVMFHLLSNRIFRELFVILMVNNQCLIGVDSHVPVCQVQ